MSSSDSKTPAEACCTSESGGTKERSGWLMAIPVMGVLFCCGGPLIGTWLASVGLLAVMGSWWAGAGHWVAMGLAVAVVGGLSWRLAPRRGRKA